MTKRKEFWAAGVYLREHEIVCVLGQVELSQVPTIGTEKIPNAGRTTEYPVPSVDCQGKSPEEAVRQSAEALVAVVAENKLELGAVHVASFGGFVSLKQADKRRVRDPRYGVMTNVSAYPEGWDGLRLHSIFEKAFRDRELSPHIDVGTNVDAAAFGEFLYGCRNLRGQELMRYVNETTLVCLNFSRTINIGIVRNGDLWTGENHPLLAMQRPARFTIEDGEGNTLFDLFEGNCPYHRDCLEGLVGVAALEERTGFDDFRDIPEDHEVWELLAYYVAQACISVVSILVPSTIILTGRCTRQIEADAFSEVFLKRVRGHFYGRISDGCGNFRPAYLDPAQLAPEEFIRLPSLPHKTPNGKKHGGVPGRHGALRLAAKQVLIKNKRLKIK